jgi:hypothetical protein
MWVTYGVKAEADREVETNVSSNRILPRVFAATAADAAVAATYGNVLPAGPCDRTNKTVSTFPELNTVAALALISTTATAATGLQLCLLTLGLALFPLVWHGPFGHPDPVSTEGCPPERGCSVAAVPVDIDPMTR